MAKKTKKDIEKELALYGSYKPDFEKGDNLVSNKLVNIKNVKKIKVLEIVKVITPINGGMPSYRIWNKRECKHLSELCSKIDLNYRKLHELETAIFTD